ncbi:hypothetical protein [Oceanobacillus indicireducens]|uniref:Uncharacterized protein n=1 Tax=Oceanobacillus indicireducens TaxID=1004261 RepID=A0A917XYE6_9BACI|nr:hypothetical protein [Oceanobacillus indicireducens]GGN59361.1 hypothetical protein GCM10007971_22400 [Oceanobacillus indicireducens]
MKPIEYKKLENELAGLLLKFQGDNNIPEEWLLRMLLENAQKSTVRFKGWGE